ncbi:tryptophan 2,3-dioxygenase [Roseomonas nepalensis]|uniref:Tryptophan 2,3-dioxygenase n=2 Tax=Muricoccus nepalensis TaxID=1854500 RepID=A0A502FUY7_9PROT|nr:tryptophan 2,3-dioxygenase [Roseomonas nepalensis]
MSYGAYLDIDTLLSAQKPLSDHHDELLFIVIHHVQELWMKLIIRELEVATACVREGDLRPAFKSLARVSRIQRQLVEAWDVLSTMTPADYLAFRDVLGQSSGFQSWQYRLMEILLGARDEFMLRPHAHDAAVSARLQAAFDAPSLYQEALRLVARRGIPVPESALGANPAERHAEDEGVVEAWATVYRHSTEYFDLYELAEELVDLEDAFQQWRFRHVTTVERVIGMRTGTGGSAGVAYLRKALERRFFPELWAVRGRL